MIRPNESNAQRLLHNNIIQHPDSISNVSVQKFLLRAVYSSIYFCDQRQSFSQWKNLMRPKRYELQLNWIYRNKCRNCDFPFWFYRNWLCACGKQSIFVCVWDWRFGNVIVGACTMGIDRLRQTSITAHSDKNAWHSTNKNPTETKRSK